MKRSTRSDPHDPQSLDAAGLFRAIFEQAAVGVAQIETATGRFLRVNQRYSDIVGYSRQELERLDFPPLTHPDDLAADLENIRRLVAGEIREFTMETRYRHKEGCVVWVNLTVSPLWAPGEPPSCHMAMVEDITARKQAETALGQRNEELAVLNALGRAVNSTLALGETAKAALTGMLNAVHPDLAFLFLREGDRLVLQEVLPPAGRLRLGVIPEHRVGECMCGLAVREGRPLYSRDIFNDRRCTWEECKRAGLKSFAALPLRSGDQIIGVIGLASAAERDFERQAGFLETLADQVSVALANAQLFEAVQRELVERQRAEAALREGEDRLRTIIGRAPFGAHSYELQAGDRLVLTATNQSADRILGIDHAPLIGRSIEEAFPGLRGTAIPDTYRRLAATEGSLEDEHVVYEQGGIRGAFAIHAFHTGSNRMTVFFRDITERKRAEAALRDSEALYQSLVENLQQCVFRKDRYGRFTFANQRFCDLIGRPLAGLIGQTDFDLFPRELAEKYQRDDQRVMASGQVFEGVESHRTPAGEEGFVQVVKTPLRDATGQVVGLQGIFWDVSERQRHAAALRASEGRLNEAERLAHLGSWETRFVPLEDPSKNLLFWSDETFRIFGYEPGAVPVTHDLFFRGVHPEDQPKVRAAVEIALREGTFYQAEHRIVRPDGSERIVLEQAEVIRDPATGQPVRLMGTVQDITERNRAEAEREKLQAQLTQAQKMESVGRLAGGVAHDFNNMLQAILGNAALALEEIPPDSPLRESLEEIRKSAERSADLTRQLLAFARKQTIQPKVLDLNETVEGMLKMLRRLIGENVHLAWLPGADLWPVKMDPSQIDQILANLCVNARDAIADTGKATIETSNVVLDDTCTQSHLDCVPGNYVMLAVSDTGQGMDADTRSHLFEPFFTTKQPGKGTGLGLAMVFGIVKQNHGLINVYSEPGRGTTFRIYLPRAEAEAVAAAEDTVQRSLRGSETVLFVEDEEQILNLGRRILQRQGYTVLAAPTPEEALALAAQQAGPIHLLVTDVVMPGMNGKELRGRLRTTHPELQCLFMSGYTADVIAHHGVLDAGVAFLQKPFTIQTLAEKVREVLEHAMES